MAGQSDGRSLERTPTWAVAVVCFVLVSISIFIEHIILLIGKWLNKRQKRSLYGAFEKVKSELMLLGFISLLLTVGQDPISNICIPKSVGDTWHPCRKKQDANSTTNYQSQLEKQSRKLLATVSNFDGSFRRVLAAAGTDKCAAKNEVALVSADGIHQLHIFIFVLAVFHVLNCILTMALGGAKMRSWKAWESETRTLEFQLTNDPERFRFTRQTSFGRRHLSFWTKNPLLIWIVCLFRQFVRSVPKVDYLTLRHGFIIAHLPPQSHENFDFQKYIKRSLEDDFKVVVGISPPLWLFAMLFLLFNTNGWNSHLWLPFIPLIIIVLVGAKLQVIITKMGLRIQERGDVVKGTPVVEPGDDLFWFKRPRIILHLINFVLFQNAFQLAFFAWTWYEFGVKSCFHEDLVEVILRISMGVLIQILCSYVTLPLYALVTQMGSRMKPVIFSDGVATALRKWHQTAKKRIKQNRSGSVTPISSPSRHTSPVHLLRHYNFFSDSLRTSQNNLSDTEGSLSPHHQHCLELGNGEESSSSHVHVAPHPEIELTQQIDIGLQDFSFDKRKSTLRAVQHCVELGDVEESSSSHVHVAPQPETEHAQQVEINVGLQDFSFDKRKSTLRAVQD